MNTIIAKAGVDDDRMYEQAAEILKRQCMALEETR